MSGSAWAGRVRAVLGALALTLVAAAGPARAQSPVLPYGTNDFGGFRNVLPPGTNGLDNLVQLAAFEATGARPAHNNDQLGMYENLIKGAPNITQAQIPDYYKDATFGVQSTNVASQESPEPGVTIVRDSQFGVPHIYGATRAALMFGIGYASAEDRLFLIDVLRHAGAADLASFAGGSNAAMDQSQWQIAPYTQQDLDNQVEYVRTHAPDGQQIYEDGLNYVDGINAYISAAELNPSLMPGEYAALGMPQGPAMFKSSDLISIASLVGGIFGQGGGSELQNALLEQSMEQRFGPERQGVPGSPDQLASVKGRSLRKTRARHKRRRGTGRHHSARHRRGARRARAARHRKQSHRASQHSRRHRTRRAPRGAAGQQPSGAVDHSGFAAFLDFARVDDPEAPTTVHTGASFPYRTLPARTAPGSLAMPDPGSLHMANVVASSGGGSQLPTVPGSASPLIPPAAKLGFPRTDSNALLISAADSASGHALAVMGPQVAYFSPEILMEQDIHGPGVDATGAAFPGVNIYVELGHGRDYAWSATSSGQDIIDTFAVPLCDPSGNAPTTSSDSYVYQGQCLPMETLTRTESWTPNPSDNTGPGSQTLQVQRTKLGLVVARATIGGRPVAYTRLRATYMHELDSAEGFYLFNNPARMRNPQQFMDAANQIKYTFNWFYLDDQHIAYFNSGANPVRAPNTNPLFPVWSSFPWQSYNGDSNTYAEEPQSAHPQVVDQDYLTSWNNKQAPGYADGDTGEQFASVYRSQTLDAGIHGFLDQGHKMTLADLVNAMGNAATQDLRGVQVLPYALRILGHPADPQLAQAVATLQAWVAGGAHRIDPTGSGHYADAQAVQIMDAWWPLLVKADLGPTLGDSLLNQVESQFPINDEPGHGVSGPHLGSAFDVGFYGVVQKDLRAALGDRVSGPLSRVYCGQGSLDACRTALESSLSQALGESATQVYPADDACQAGDQACSDSIRFRPVGAISQPEMPWQNRPTFQQANEIQGHGPRQ